MNMLTLEAILTVLPAAAAGLALLGYAGLLWYKRRLEQAKPELKPIPIDSKRRHDSQG
jgi:hypothetical protein